MNGSTARVTKRQIRKAFGDEATALVKAQHQGLQQHAQAIEALMGVVFTRNLLGRLWWLVTGR